MCRIKPRTLDGRFFAFAFAFASAFRASRPRARLAPSPQTHRCSRARRAPRIRGASCARRAARRARAAPRHRSACRAGSPRPAPCFRTRARSARSTRTANASTNTSCVAASAAAIAVRTNQSVARLRERLDREARDARGERHLEREDQPACPGPQARGICSLRPEHLELPRQLEPRKCRNSCVAVALLTKNDRQVLRREAERDTLGGVEKRERRPRWGRSFALVGCPGQKRALLRQGLSGRRKAHYKP